MKKSISTVILFLFTSSPSLLSAHPLSGIKKSLISIQEAYRGIQQFLDLINSVISHTGFPTIVFILAVLVAASGLVSLGIPRGVGSFIVAMALVDTIWIMWNVSFSHEPLTPSLVKANMLAIFPMVFFYLLFTLGPVAVKRVMNLFTGSRVTRQKLALHHNNLAKSYSDFSQAVTRKLETNSQEIIVTGEMKRYLEDMEKEIQILKKKSSSDENNHE
jgi:hypothetical protein